MKTFLMITALAVASLSIASAKSYEIVLNAPATAGQTQLSAGHYMVKVDGANAQFLNIENRSTVSVPVRIESSKTKFDYTAVDTTKSENGAQQIQSIELQDTNSKLEF